MHDPFLYLRRIHQESPPPRVRYPKNANLPPPDYETATKSCPPPPDYQTAVLLDMEMKSQQQAQQQPPPTAGTTAGATAAAASPPEIEVITVNVQGATASPATSTSAGHPSAKA